jgi:hypothetical protein
MRSIPRTSCYSERCINVDVSISRMACRSSPVPHRLMTYEPGRASKQVDFKGNEMRDGRGHIVSEGGHGG